MRTFDGEEYLYKKPKTSRKIIFLVIMILILSSVITYSEIKDNLKKNNSDEQKYIEGRISLYNEMLFALIKDKEIIFPVVTDKDVVKIKLIPLENEEA